MIDFTDGGARLHVAVLADAGRLTFTLTGELDGISGPPLTDVLNTAMDDGVDHVDVDMAQVGFADLQGLRALLRAYQACARRGVALMLRDPQPHVAKLLLWFSDTAALLPVGGTASGGTTSADVEACPPAASRRLSPMTAGEPSPGGPQATDSGHDDEPRPATTDNGHNNRPEPATTDSGHDDEPRPATTDGNHNNGEPGPATTLRERDQHVREREEEADDRERLMRARDQLLDERQQRVSEHQRWEDIREDLADIREGHLERREHER